MSDLDILLDDKKFFKRALSTIDIKEFESMNQMERAIRLADIYDSRNKVLNYLGYNRLKDEKGIWKIAKSTPPEQKEIEYYEKWLGEYYKEKFD